MKVLLIFTVAVIAFFSSIQIGSDFMYKAYYSSIVKDNFNYYVNQKFEEKSFFLNNGSLVSFSNTELNVSNDVYVCNYSKVNNTKNCFYTNN